jgi:hypothetical protein
MKDIKNWISSPVILSQFNQELTQIFDSISSNNYFKFFEEHHDQNSPRLIGTSRLNQHGKDQMIERNKFQKKIKNLISLAVVIVDKHADSYSIDEHRSVFRIMEFIMFIETQLLPGIIQRSLQNMNHNSEKFKAWLYSS